LYLKNIDIQRDWGWAEDYVVAMYLMLQQEQLDDYKGRDGGELFSWRSRLRLRLGWWGWIGGSMWASDKGLRRPTDLAVSRENPAKAMERLGWVAKRKIADLVRLTIEARKDK
jgi:GDPmannose 4,6-dehydratase